MKTRPILFSGPMVRAILEGRKTQTRRVVKEDVSFVEGGNAYGFTITTPKPAIQCPYGATGDRLWVRETSRCGGWDPSGDYEFFSVGYEADNTYQSRRVAMTGNASPYKDHRKATPAIHMPRWASRITLEIVSVRVERLQDITAEDCRREGIVFDPDKTPIPSAAIFYKSLNDTGHKSLFRDLWESINGPGSWELNPWVLRIEFKRIK